MHLEMVQFHPKMAKITFLIARSRELEQGNILSQPAPFLFYNTTPPFPLFPVSHHERSVKYNINIPTPHTTPG
jgi:hypothetical protein